MSKLLSRCKSNVRVSKHCRGQSTGYETNELFCYFLLQSEEVSLMSVVPKKYSEAKLYLIKFGCNVKKHEKFCASSFADDPEP